MAEEAQMSVSMAYARMLVRMERSGIRSFADPERMWGKLDPNRKPYRPPIWLRGMYSVNTRMINGRPAYRVEPRNANGREVIYLHGGAYIHPMGLPHWWVITELIRRSGAAVTVPTYPLAPEHTVDDAIGLLDGIYREISEEPRLQRLTLAGDSAGGGLALAQAIRTRDAGWRPADHLVLYSPWVDVALTNPEARELEESDVMLRIAGSAEAGRAWAGPRGVDDPMVSPLRDSLADLPPMTVFAGDRDILTPDVRRLVAKARAAGTSVDFVEEPGAFHIYIAAVWTPESQAALDRSAAAIRGES